ncbi:hypothetical protein Bbelb_162770 [Branchiostoma belcheri]|nr:hypothetical protein Bbelb_162770 [Branchiostoma belcheri]
MAESSDRALTEGQIKQISSAYIKWFTTVSPTTHPTPDFDNSALTSDTYTLNRNGDNRLPCGRPLLAVNVSERVRPQRTEKDKVSYHITRNLTRYIGTPRSMSFLTKSSD